jgi:hypothetical protein
MWWALGGALGGTVLLILLISWVARSKYALGKIETENAILREAQKRRSEADVTFQEPVADESAWLDAQRDRLRDARDRD